MHTPAVFCNNEPQYKVFHCRSGGHKWTVLERRIPRWYFTGRRYSEFRSKVMVSVEADTIREGDEDTSEDEPTSEDELTSEDGVDI